MYLLHVMEKFEKENHPAYVSCIRIANRPILPPLVDSVTREIIHSMQKRAVALEQKLMFQKFCKTSWSMTNNCNELETTSLITDNKNKLETPDLVTDNDNKLEMLDTLGKESSLHESVETEHYENDSTEDAMELTLNSEINDDFSNDSPRPLRRNSYTLEHPSEIMLAHLRSLFASDSDVEDPLLQSNLTGVSFASNNSSTCDDYSAYFTSSICAQTDINCTQDVHELHKFADNVTNKTDILEESISNLSINKNCGDKDTNFDNFCNVSKNVTRNSACGNTTFDIDRTNKGNTILTIDNNKNLAHKIDHTKLRSSISCDDYLLNSQQDPINKMQNNFNVVENVFKKNPFQYSSNKQDNRSDFCNHMNDKTAMENKEFSSLSPVESSYEWRKEYEAYIQFFHQLKIKHVSDLVELLERQKKEQMTLFAQFQNCFCVSDMADKSPRNSFTDSSCTTCNCYSENIFNKLYVDNRYESVTPGNENLCTNLNVQPNTNSDNQDLDLKKQKAAIVITAAVKGYLTRRLFRTERVSNLVHIIKDCLIIAVSLQTEKELSLPDLDLQCRLLQQLTVACNELYDIFSLPVKDRMKIIANDVPKKSTEAVKEPNTPLPLTEATKLALLRRKMITNKNNNDDDYNNDVIKDNIRKQNKTIHREHYLSSPSADKKSVSPKLPTAVLKQKCTVKQVDKRPWR